MAVRRRRITMYCVGRTVHSNLPLRPHHEAMKRRIRSRFCRCRKRARPVRVLSGIERRSSHGRVASSAMATSRTRIRSARAATSSASSKWSVRRSPTPRPPLPAAGAFSAPPPIPQLPLPRTPIDRASVCVRRRSPTPRPPLPADGAFSAPPPPAQGPRRGSWSNDFSLSLRGQHPGRPSPLPRPRERERERERKRERDTA